MCSLLEFRLCISTCPPRITVVLDCGVRHAESPSLGSQVHAPLDIHTYVLHPGYEGIRVASADWDRSRFRCSAAARYTRATIKAGKRSCALGFNKSLVNPLPEIQKLSNVVMSTAASRGHVLACSHGAGPLVLLGEPSQQPLIHVLRDARYVLENSKGIIVVTAHWQTEQPTISAAAQHELLFDYPKTLPKEAFEVEYPAPGSPELARKVGQKLQGAGFEPRFDHERGWDHGVYVPMTYLRPEADIPVVQMSVLKSQDTDEHIKIGQALAPLRDEGYTIICSGSSWHHLGDMMTSIMKKRPIARDCHSFAAALDEAMLTFDGETRLEKLKGWQSWPDANYIHSPKHAEHFMPFMVGAGAGASGVTEKKPSWDLWGVEMATYVW